ncbi:2-hydroxyacid dehydrogenase [Legionella waltersii]|uniref:2-hydroxyacid dehydrogenase n=1 Tax=Legionella waltersii TaxID=66969 RepID=A0A0W1A190_9GAMM|nr:2-hydroxyacid dehydrogenase [Legionella waltersii]KTD75137.1 2-hydroxyacid dehydrogenase [Legionella waltersii]SNV04872.1 2-hydroxyacid dehydrogenase [Legionella waltersii]
MKISFLSTQQFEQPIFDQANTTHHHQINYLNFHLTPESVNALEASDVVCCFVNDFINSEVINALSQKGVKLIALRSAGYNHVDIEYAKKKGIKVCRVPAYSPQSVAEHTIALILCLNRKIHQAHNRVREGNFSLHGLMGFNLFQKTVGIIGTGKIGTAVARILNGFGCKLLGYDPQPSEECKKLGLEYVDITELLKSSDIISLHCPLNDQTRYIINEQTIALMKKGVMLINTGRGKLINTKSAINALKIKQLGYLGIDVYEEEEPLFFEDHSEEIINDDVFCRLLTFPNVLITGHQGFFTQEAVLHIAQTTLENITNFESNKGTVYLV